MAGTFGGPLIAGLVEPIDVIDVDVSESFEVKI